MFFFLKNIKLYNKKRLKKHRIIEIERIISWNLLSMIKPRLLLGKNPPDEISVNDILNESNILNPDNDSKINITSVNII